MTTGNSILGFHNEWCVLWDHTVGRVFQSAIYIHKMMSQAAEFTATIGGVSSMTHFTQFTNGLYAYSLNLYSNDSVRSQFCTCHDSSAVMTCAKLGPDQIMIFQVKVTWIFTRFGFVPKSPINKIPALFQIMACPRPGDKPLSEAMLTCHPYFVRLGTTSSRRGKPCPQTTRKAPISATYASGLIWNS